MARTIKNILLLVAAALAAVIAVRMLLRHAPPAAEQPPAPAEVPQAPGPFDGLGIRFDGHYLCERGSLRYLIRFFPEGRVVLINGAKEMEEELPKFLIRETKGDPAHGLHNVMATVRGDSIFFVTKPLRGEISYRGRAEGADRVHFIRHSHINGAVFDMEYRFVPASGQQPS